MLCPQCHSSNKPGATVCSQCGAALAAPRSSLSSLADDLRQQIREEFGRSMKSGPDSGVQGGRSVAPPPTSQPAAPAPAGARRFDASAVDPQEVVGLMIPQAAEVQQSANFTFASPFIQGNPLYQQRIGQVSFVYMPGDATLNAFATDQPLPIGQGQAVQPPLIVFYEGLATALRLAGSALAVHVQIPQARMAAPSESPLSAAFRLMGQAVLESGGNFTAENSVSIFSSCVVPRLRERDEHVISLSRSYAAAMESFIVAHEAGHLALGHTLSASPNYDVSRNQEREADSFAASALCTSPFREYLFLGSVFVTIIFSWVDHASGKKKGITHPLARERFFNILRSNPSAAEEAARRLGLTTEVLMELLPRM
jgi:hypothetical protein